jgi:hypothetical protein
MLAPGSDVQAVAVPNYFLLVPFPLEVGVDLNMNDGQKQHA